MENLKLQFGTNAWVFLNEDEPKNSNYNSPDSCFQSLIKHNVYESVSFLGIAFFEVVQAKKGDGTTIQVGAHTHPEGLSNQDYLNFIIEDARRCNPKIKFLTTMIYSGSKTLAAVFSGSGNEQTEATEFAINLVQYLRETGMNGLDVDWEGDVSMLMNKNQFKTLFSRIREVFDEQPEKFYLSFTPAWPTPTIDYDTVNSAFDFVSPQFYDGTPLLSFLDAGISPKKIGYGAQFEPGNAAPNNDAQQVWSEVSSGFTYKNASYNYLDIFMWRFNSNNFQFEQAQFMILTELANPSTSNTFDDKMIVGAAGNPSITQMTIRFGNVLNAIQCVNTGKGPYNTGTQDPNTGVFNLLQHGGDSGSVETINIPLNDPIVAISGYTGDWYGRQCVLQLTLTGKSGKIYGPFGSMDGSISQNKFTQDAPSGKSIVAFSGSLVNVPLADGSQTDIIASLNAVFA